jgi:hypothetical protein
MKKEDQPQGLSEADEPIDSSMMPDLSKNESPMLDEEWLSLTKDWQEQPFEKTDMSALVKKTKRRTYWAKSILVLDVLSTIFVFALFIYGCFVEQWSNSVQLFLLFFGIGSTVYVYYEVKYRLHAWQQNCGSPEKAVEHAIAGCESSIKFSKLVKLFSWLMFPSLNGFLYLMMIDSEKSLWPPIIITNILLVATVVITHIIENKRIAELALLSKV